jgi:two-component system phosphate regulon response regulator PhoB
MAHIIVVDDEAEIVRLVCRLLETRGHRVTIARDGQEALDAVAAEKPDVLVIDQALPKVSGLDVTRRLRSEPATRDLPVVLMLTVPPSVEDADRELTSGPDEYVLKPFLHSLLVQNVERLIR